MNDKTHKMLEMVSRLTGSRGYLIVPADKVQDSLKKLRSSWGTESVRVLSVTEAHKVFSERKEKGN